MKQIQRNSVLLILVFAFFWKDIVSVTYQIDYYLNKQDYLVRCVNKAQPKLHCNGKCQLALKLQKTAMDAQSDLDKNTNKQPFKYREFEAYTWIVSFPTIYLHGIQREAKQPIAFDFRKIPQYFSSSIFHPPIV